MLARSKLPKVLRRPWDDIIVQAKYELPRRTGIDGYIELEVNNGRRVKAGEK